MATSRSGSPQADQEEDKRLLSPLLVSLFSANSLRPGGSRRLGGSRRAPRWERFFDGRPKVQRPRHSSSPLLSMSRGRPTKWAGSPTRYKDVGTAKLDTIILGHLTQEQIDAYQQYFRVEEISHLFRQAYEQRLPVLLLLPSGSEGAPPQYKRDPSPPPRYDAHGQRVNTRENRTRMALDNERHFLVNELLQSVANYMPPVEYRKPTKTSEKIYIPVKDYPDINFVGMLLGPRGHTLRQLQEQSGAKLAIRGKGSVKDGKSEQRRDHPADSTAISSASFLNPNLQTLGEDDLHVLITSDSQESIVKAIRLTNEVIEKAILSPVGQNDLKRGQLRELAVLNGTLRETKPYEPQHLLPQGQRRPLGLDVLTIVCNNCGKVGHFARDCLVRKTRDDAAAPQDDELWKRNRPNLPMMPRLPATSANATPLPGAAMPGFVPPASATQAPAMVPAPAPLRSPPARADLPQAPSFISTGSSGTSTSSAPMAPPGVALPSPPAPSVVLPPPPSTLHQVRPPPSLTPARPPPPPTAGTTSLVLHAPPPPPSTLRPPPPSSRLPPPPPTVSRPPPPPGAAPPPPLLQDSPRKKSHPPPPPPSSS